MNGRFCTGDVTDSAPTQTSSALHLYLTRPAATRGQYGWGRIAAAFGLLLVGCAIVVVGIATFLATVGTADGSAAPPVMTVLQMAVIALWAVVVWAVARALFGMRLADVFSWVPGIRWGVLAKSTAIALVGLGAYYGVLFAISKDQTVPLTSGVLLAVAAAILLIPLQALAEELLFRAFGPQVIHGKIGVSAASYVIVSLVFSALFASFHGAGTLAAWLAFFILAIVFAVLVYATAGVEAAVAVHAVNNVLLVVSGLLKKRDIAASQGNVTVDLTVVVQILVVIAVAAVIILATRRERAAR